MKVGTKSLLFGVHQFLWHPLTVLIAWHHLYGWPTWREIVCIFIHDWGLWGSSDIDGKEGLIHPARSAAIARKLFGKGSVESLLVLFHSRHFARLCRMEPSMLCWADKLSIRWDPWWLYIPRAILSGEIIEYREMSAKNQWRIPLSASHRTWYERARKNQIELAMSMDPTKIAYQDEER